MQDEVTVLKTDNSSFERVEEFKYLRTILTNQNSIQEEIKGRLNSGNACYCNECLILFNVVDIQC
jgi:hypothetical protein